MEGSKRKLFNEIHALPESTIPHDEDKVGQLIPILTVPNEILQVIFDLYSNNKTAKDLLVLTRICRLWRSVALGCSEIWSNISPSMRPQLLDFFLEHSKNRPLNVTYSHGNWGTSGHTHEINTEFLAP